MIKDEVLLIDILNIYARERGLGEIRDYSINNTYNSDTISIHIEFVNKEYLQSIIDQLKVGVKLDAKDSKYAARLLGSHPILESFVNDYSDESGEIIDHPLVDDNAADAYRAEALEHLDSPTYGDLQSPAAEKLHPDYQEPE